MKMTKMTTLFLTFLVGATVLSTEVMASQNTERQNHGEEINLQISSDEVSPYAPHIDWRYKTENGRIYRRLYNYSTRQWIGEWERV